MSKVNGDSIQVGINATATKNCTLTANGDDTFTLARGNAGATTQDLMTIDANGAVIFPQGGQLTSGTAIATTSGTEHDFTGIPSWVKNITLIIGSVSTNSTSNLLIQIGDSGGIETTGYIGQVQDLATSSVRPTTGFGVTVGTADTSILDGIMTIYKVDGNTWICSGTLTLTTNHALVSAGSKTLSGTLDRIRLTTTNGTDTFDAGKINILYEG